jgi:hypothetical protein
MRMPIEPIHSTQRPGALSVAIDAFDGNAQDLGLEPLYEAAVRDTLGLFDVL